MPILLDHCVRRKIYRLLQIWGYEAYLLQDHTQPDAEDADVLQIAQDLDSVLLTEDLDFGNILDYPPQQYSGIIVLRIQAADEAQVIDALKQLLEDLYRDGLRGVLVVVTSDHYRVRR